MSSSQNTKEMLKLRPMYPGTFTYNCFMCGNYSINNCHSREPNWCNRGVARVPMSVHLRGRQQTLVQTEKWNKQVQTGSSTVTDGLQMLLGNVHGHKRT